MSRDLQQQRDANSDTQSAADVDVDAEHNPEVSRRSSNAGLRRQVQMKGGTASADSEQVQAAAQRGTAGPGSALPHADKIQQAFGSHDISDVRAHVGANAQAATGAMGAEAYATGNQIAFGKQPDLHTAAHEAAHVVQQKKGVSISGGVGSAGDAYEKQADAVADQVVAGQSAEHLLGAPSGGASAAPGQAVQKKDATAKPVDKAAAHTKSESASGFGAQSALKHLAVQMHDWGNKVIELSNQGSAEGSGKEPAAQGVEAILSSMETHVDMVQNAIAAVPKGVERTVLAKDVQAVQWAWNRFNMVPVPKLTSLFSETGRSAPNLSGMKATIDGFTQQIGYESADLPLTDVKVEGDEKSLAKTMMDDQVTALAAALDSVKAGNDDVHQVNIHARYIDNVGRDEPVQIKAHHAQLKKLRAELEAIQKDKPTLDLGEAHGHLAKLSK